MGIWICKCGNECEDNFCSKCGNKRPESFEDLPANWICKCGAECDSNFCSKCGNKRPEKVESVDNTITVTDENLTTEDNAITNENSYPNENTISDEKTFLCNNCGARIIVNSNEGTGIECEKCGFKANYFNFNYLNAVTPTVTRLNIENLPDLKIGEEFSFGRIAEYQLRWKVIDFTEGKIEAIGEPFRFLCKLPYNEEAVPTTWNECSLRKFLNEEFFNAVFSEDERSRIINTNITCEDNSVFGTSGGESTVDKVFILSADEASRLIPDDFNKKKTWWLRTPGYNNLAASFYSKEVDYIGEQVNKKDVYASPQTRPVIWIDISGIPRYEREVTKEFKTDYKKGDELELGFDPHRGSIKWRVLDVKDNRALIITKDIFKVGVFDIKQEDDYGYTPLWEKSILRKWLNEDFLDKYLTEEEKKRVLVTNNLNNNVKKDDDSIIEAHATNDKVFLLSKDEAKSYFSGDEDRACEGCPWLLRTTDEYFIECVNYTGEIDKARRSAEHHTGIRMAMWIDCN